MLTSSRPTLSTVWTVKQPKEKWVWCCYLRPAPNDISFDKSRACLYRIDHILEAIKNQGWYPYYCFYCYSCIVPRPGLGTDNWEKHIVGNHPGLLAYPGSAPLLTTGLLKEIEGRHLEWQ